MVLDDFGRNEYGPQLWVDLRVAPEDNVEIMSLCGTGAVRFILGMIFSSRIAPDCPLRVLPPTGCRVAGFENRATSYLIPPRSTQFTMQSLHDIIELIS